MDTISEKYTQSADDKNLANKRIINLNVLSAGIVLVIAALTMD